MSEGGDNFENEHGIFTGGIGEIIGAVIVVLIIIGIAGIWGLAVAIAFSILFAIYKAFTEKKQPKTDFELALEEEVNRDNEKYRKNTKASDRDLWR
ncbi:hypothetical protein [Shewanella sp. UCD-KL12]|uniref:hypothetical protein n=1 Tax=Shewanella sp. UCD-KL12 TaxID=1917163 RepID=UPI000971042A|nr:hypothetical protein [Shewanella sp. UCD-KL12]